MDELQARRRTRREREATGEIADMLHEYHQAAIDGTHEWGGAPPRAIVIIPIEDGELAIDWAGALNTGDLERARQAIDDAIHPERADARREWEAESKRRAEEYERTHPVNCSHERCTQRFKTDQGRKMHERSCRYIRYDKQPAQG